MNVSYFFKSLPLGMNMRNFLIRRLNPPESLRLAKDKSRFKKLLSENNIPVARTYFEIRNFYEIGNIPAFPDEFVIKPNNGSGGSGILVLKREGEVFVNPAGEKYAEKDIRYHIRKILSGEFSSYRARPIAIIEERIYPSSKLNFKYAIGLPDIRIFCYRFKPVMAMMRYSTVESRGRANLAKGAIGMALDLETGKITHIHAKGNKSSLSPEYFDIPESFSIPRWEEMKEISVKAAKLAGLNIAGVDLILDDRDRVLVLEINGRPGIEIQNINELSLLEKFDF